jgi:hypothetical protein
VGATDHTRKRCAHGNSLMNKLILKDIFMKRKILTLLWLSIIFCDIIADDGVFFARGNSLIPLEETSIELKKEILILNGKGNPIDISVYFEFFNPGDDIERLVGFVTPPSDGVIDDSLKGLPQILNFKVSVNDQLLEYKVASIDSTEFTSIFKNSNCHEFIYYFKVKFKKGLNIIRHSYSYSGGWSADEARPGPYYEYRLTTGKSWANKKIDSFELYINVGNDSYFTIPTSFENGKIADWQIIGTGKTGTINPNYKMERFVKMKAGFLYFKAIDFKPDIDLTISTVIPISELDCNVSGMGYECLKILSHYSDNDLRVLRNSFYAIYDYQFKTKDLIDYFSKFNWYLPDPNIKESDIVLDSFHQSLLDKIIQEEKKRKPVL